MTKINVEYKGYEYYLDFSQDTGHRERVFAILGLIRNDDQFDLDDTVLVDYDPSKDIVTLRQGDYRLPLQVRLEATACSEKLLAAGARWEEA